MTNEPSKTEPAAPLGFGAKLWREIIRPYGEAILFAVLITTFIFTSVGVDGVSMMPNLRHGERVIIPKYEQWLHRFGIGDYSRGDILIFKPPAHTGERMASFLGLWEYQPFLIKRLVGLPGDKLKIEKGEVFINGKQLDASFTTAYWKDQGCWDQDSSLASRINQDLPADQTEITVPPNEYFVMGDNRTASGSTDSRIFGTVPIDKIAGRATLIVWPLIRQVNAKYHCNYGGDDPSTAVDFSGDTIFNGRILQRPDGFSNVK